MREARRRASQRSRGAPRYLIETMAQDVVERLDFMRFEPARALVIGDWTNTIATALAGAGSKIEERNPSDRFGAFDPESPFPLSDLDLVVSIGTLDTANDVPGALLHMCNALAPGGLLIAEFPAAGSLARLRAAMLASDEDRAYPRLHPMIDNRSASALLERAGFARHVVDGYSLDVRYSSLAACVADLRAQGLGSVLQDRPPPLSRTSYARAAEHFAKAGEGGKTVERFEILTLTGWR